MQYIEHSGFLVEMEKVYFLFDYYKGELPEFNPEKRLFIFVSHKHADHYNREIWRLKDSYRDVSYIVSKDIPFSARQRALLGISEEDCARVVRVRANEMYYLEDREGEAVSIATLKSTDLGVAYLVSYKGYHIYHAGDLNRWVWKGETEAWNQEMANKYSQQLEELQKILGTDRISIAFLPVDPRQEEEAFGGICEFLKKIAVDTVFPMHLWEQYKIVEQCVEVLKERVSKEAGECVVQGMEKKRVWKREKWNEDGVS